MEFFIVGVISLIVGCILGVKVIARTAKPVISERLSMQAIDRSNYLFTLRRELANILIGRNPRRYLQLYQELRTELKSLESWHIEEINRHLSELCKKYPSYNDFDILNIREYVLYADGVSWLSYEELVGRYRDIVTFIALSLIGDLDWKDASSRGWIKLDITHKYSSAEIEHLSEYVERIEDTKLQLAIDSAMEVYYANGGLQKGSLDNKLFTVQHIYHPSPDSRYGIHLKSTDEFAIYSLFVYEDGHASYSYYRSDSKFEREESLNVLHALLDEKKQGSMSHP